MGLSRRFQNLIVESPSLGIKWLRCVDLTRQLFDNTVTPPSTIGDGSESAAVQDSASQTLATDAGSKKNKQAGVAAALKMERIQLPRPIFRFQPTDHPYYCNIDCFPLSDSKVVIADQTGRTTLCDVDRRHLVPMPNLYKKSNPISHFVPSADAEDHPSNGDSLYIMESIPRPEKGDSAQPSDQFEAFVRSSKPTGAFDSEGLWHCQPIPPPPFVRDPAYWFTYPKIRSYAVVGTNIYVSAECNVLDKVSVSYERIGTYCLDTASNTWEVGTGVLPFYGKAEYVAELKLWFGLSSEVGPLAAADLSAVDMDSQPQLVGDWKEFDPPEGWLDYRQSLTCKPWLRQVLHCKILQTCFDG